MGPTNYGIGHLALQSKAVMSSLKKVQDIALSSVLTPAINVAFDDDSSPMPSHDALNKPPGIIVPPKPLTPHPCVTDPPLHPESMTPIILDALSTPHENPPATEAPAAP